MAEYEQMELDVRLESEKSLKDNVARVIQFAYEQRNLEAKEYGMPIPAVRNKHEGYGIAAEAWSKVQVREKDIKNGMNNYLALLQVKGEDAVQSCAALYDASLNLAIEAISMAADMSRIMNDLYYGYNRKTPLKEYADGIDDKVTDEAAVGFEDAEPETVEGMDENAENEALEAAGEEETEDDE